MVFKRIDYTTAKDFLLPRHYSGRTPSITFAFGYYEQGELVAVCTFGKPASPNLCDGVCGKLYRHKVFELNRLLSISDTLILSYFVGKCLRNLRKENLIIISYADTAMCHVGKIYQASNFLYTGATKKRTDKYTEGGKHSRHYTNESNDKRKVRSSKHRYIYFCANKWIKKLFMNNLEYEIYPYPEGDSGRYTLGHILSPQIVYM